MKFATIGILHIGEMGYHWAQLLQEHGVEVLSCAAERSEATRQRSRNAGVRLLDRMEDLVREADLIVSIVVPSAALKVAQEVGRVAGSLEGKTRIYLDANAISPMTALKIHEVFAATSVSFVDGCIIGSALRLGRAAVYVSGAEAARLNELSEYGLSIRVLGEEAGQASAFKVVYAGLTKGLAGLFTELLIGAKKFNLLDQLLERYEESFPGLPGKISGSITSLPIHAARRAEEMAELRDTFRHYGLEPVVTPSIEQILESVARLEEKKTSETGSREGALVDTINRFFEKGLLQKP